MPTDHIDCMRDFMRNAHHEVWRHPTTSAYGTLDIYSLTSHLNLGITMRII